MADDISTTNPSEGAFTPTQAAKMLVAIYGHPRWEPTGLELQALVVARTFLSQQPDPRETIPSYGHGPQDGSTNPTNTAALEEAIKHVTSFDDAQMGMLEWTKVWRLVVAGRHFVWMLKRTEELAALNAKLVSIVMDDKEGDLDFIKFQFRDTIKSSASDLDTMAAKLERLRDMSAKMAEDDGLWFIAQTTPEAYLQQELRKLCAAIEGVTPEECARAALTEKG